MMRGECGGGGYVWDGTTTINLSQKPATDSRRRKKHNIGMFKTIKENLYMMIYIINVRSIKRLEGIHYN